MKKSIAYSPTEYRNLFYQYANISCDHKEGDYCIYINNEGGSIVSFGADDVIQCGIGDYVIEDDFAIEYHYDNRFLHFGIVYKGITYSLEENDLIVHSMPSSFMAMEKMDVGTGVWRSGQHFKGVEFSIEYEYLKKSVLPMLGKTIDDLDFLVMNYRYSVLSQDMNDVLNKVERNIKNRILTKELAISYALELVALVLNPINRSLFKMTFAESERIIEAGNRTIKLKASDIRKITEVRDIITSSAFEFKTIPMLAKEVGISEQKLKYGFQDYFKQTIWDFQNSVRMSHAAWMIKEDKASFEEISKAVGYQSQTAFYNAFKNWCGLTPGKFKKHLESGQTHQ